MGGHENKPADKSLTYRTECGTCVLANTSAIMHPDHFACHSAILFTCHFLSKLWVPGGLFILIIAQSLAQVLTEYMLSKCLLAEGTHTAMVVFTQVPWLKAVMCMPRLALRLRIVKHRNTYKCLSGEIQNIFPQRNCLPKESKQRNKNKLNYAPNYEECQCLYQLKVYIIATFHWGTQKWAQSVKHC